MKPGEKKRNTRLSSKPPRIRLGSLAAQAWVAACLVGATAFAAEKDVVAPRLIHVVPPEYPVSLRAEGVEGIVTVVFKVDEQGGTHDPSISSATRSEFGDAVKTVVTRWQFEPARRDGVPVAQKVSMPVTFTLRADDPLSRWAGRNVFRKITEKLVQADEIEEWPQPEAWIEPVYPTALAGSGKRGEVVVSFVIDEHGDVINPEVLVGDDPQFVAAALAATLSLDFSPRFDEHGDPTPVSMAVAYQFDESKQRSWDRAVSAKRNPRS
jgi:TonB family protein